MDADVIVVGAGPTGLMLAGELRLGGADVLDKLAEPTGQSRGLGFTARAMEIFDQRGLLPRFGQGETLEISPVGHFGGVQFPGDPDSRIEVTDITGKGDRIMLLGDAVHTEF